MKNVTLFFLLFSFSDVIAQTLLLEENFDHSTGTLTTVNTNWTEDPTGSKDIQAVTGSLSFTNYPSSGVGQKIVLDGGAAGRSGVIHLFTVQSTDGTTVYFSFLLSVTSTADMDTSTSNGDYFCHFTGSDTSTNRAYVYVRKGADSTKYSIGLAKARSTSLVWYSTELDINITYLIVISYSFITGGDNDIVKVWINPDLSGTEPSADISINSGTDAADIGIIQFKQKVNSGDIEIDGLRVSTSWSQAPLPVELSFFKGFYSNGKINLNWQTATELNNYGFEIQRAAPLNLPEGETSGTPLPFGKGLGDGLWEAIGFVAGAGNSNSPHSYSFTDQPTGGTSFSYRLKQIDNDGKYKYYDAITVSLTSLTTAKLMQNSPNPFNPTTAIKFYIPNNSDVTIKIYDMLGREVTTLINKESTAGYHIVYWNGKDSYGRDASSGVYLYRLATGNFSETKKMQLLK